MNNRERWTHLDEMELKRLAERKAKLMAENTKPLLALVKSMSLQTLTGSDDEIVSCLMAHADELRDALEPFDSGVRCAVEQG